MITTKQQVLTIQPDLSGQFFNITNKVNRLHSSVTTVLVHLVGSRFNQQ